MQEIVVVGITGGSGSGKTTLGQMLEARTDESCLLLLQDSYYRDQSHLSPSDRARLNYDHPQALDFKLMADHLKALRKGLSVEVPCYDFATHARVVSRAQRMAPKALIIIDGILIMASPELRQELDFVVYVDTPETLRFSRRLHRDTETRGRTPESVYEQFWCQVKPMHDQYVEPGKQLANFVLSGREMFTARDLEALVERLADEFPGRWLNKNFSRGIKSQNRLNLSLSPEAFY